MAKSNNSSGGISFLGALGIAFIVLKLTNNIDWSWWWVLAPLWMGLALVVAILTIYGAYLLIVRNRKRNLSHHDALMGRLSNKGKGRMEQWADRQQKRQKEMQERRKKDRDQS